MSDTRTPAEIAYDAMKLSRGPIAPAAQPEDTDAIIRVLEAVCADELPPDIPLSPEEIKLMDLLLLRNAERTQAWADIIQTVLG